MATDAKTAGDISSEELAHQQTQAVLTAEWDVRGIAIDKLTIQKGTVVDRTRRPPSKDGPPTAGLPALLTPASDGAQPQFVLGDILGEGGMGVVRTAAQTALDRAVAVKGVKPDVDVEDSSPHLLLEGRITGALEHPNVVPVYALGSDDDGHPLLVMKRIQGRSWDAILDEVDDAARSTDSYLRVHLATLKQVAMAVHFAHSKGIIHRDLKPENVMIGGFGETYVVDWGIAVSVGEDRFPDLPSTTDIAAIEGTPAYMAPEMVAGDGELIDERSDVFLLGAILHQIITGLPPNHGKDIRAVLTCAFAAKPAELDDNVPTGLAAVCHRAMARFNEDRYQSAAAFAEAIDEFLVHRVSTLLSDEAATRLKTLRERLSDETIDEERDAESLYAAFTECRFAFQQALRSWQHNAEAQDGLQQTLELMIAFELDRDAPNAAAMLSRELPDPRPAISERIRAALDNKEQARKRLAKLERDVDLSIGDHLRRIIMLVAASSWGLLCILCGLLTRSGIYRVGHTQFALLNLAITAAVIIVVLRRRKRLLSTAANRRLASMSVLVFTSYFVLWSICGHLGIAMESVAIIHGVLGTALWTSVGVNVDRNWLPISVGTALALIATLLMPTYYFEWLGAFGALGSVVAAELNLRSRGNSASESEA